MEKNKKTKKIINISSLKTQKLRTGIITNKKKLKIESNIQFLCEGKKKSRNLSEKQKTSKINKKQEWFRIALAVMREKMESLKERERKIIKQIKDFSCLFLMSKFSFLNFTCF